MSVIRCLGILIDNKLSFVPHVDHLTSKVSRKIGALRRTFRQMAAFTRRQYLLSVIQPDFEYCFPVYASHLSTQSRRDCLPCSVDLYELPAVLHNKFIMLLYHPVLASLQIKHLEYRYIYQFLTFTFICHYCSACIMLTQSFPFAHL